MSNEFIAKYRPFDKVECCFDIVAVFDNNVERNYVLTTKSKQIEHVQLVSTLSKGRNFFDIVEEIVQLVAFDNVASTLLLVWTGL